MLDSAKRRLRRVPLVARDVTRAVLAGGHAAPAADAPDSRQTSSAIHDHRSGRVTQRELQGDLHRFTEGLIARTGQAATEIERSGKPGEVSTEALRRAINYESAALDIATQPLPEVALLDTVVFLRLNRLVLTDYWIPKVLGDRGLGFLTAFEHAEQQFSPVVDKILSAAQREHLIRRIDEWRSKNPDLVLVEFMRLSDLSTENGSVAVAGADEVRGLLASVKNATQAADHALLLGERAMFFANKLPFLIRHQTRLGGREVVRDVMVRRMLVYLTVLGATWSLIAWSWYALAKRVAR
jgi:hypothetical protein